MAEEAPSDRVVVKALPMVTPQTVLLHEIEKRRLKKGVLGGSEEQIVFAKTLYLPYLDFTYQYSAEKGFLSKQAIQAQGRSVVLALNEVELGFYPELTTLAQQSMDVESDPGSIVQGVDSTTLVEERLDALRKMLSDYDSQLLELATHYDSLPKSDRTRQAVKENIDHLRRTRDLRWKMFADGLRLPSRIDLEKLELLEGSLFYMPYFLTRLSGRGESRFLVWDREGRENDAIADELTKNERFRELIQSHVTYDANNFSEREDEEY